MCTSMCSPKFSLEYALFLCKYSIVHEWMTWCLWLQDIQEVTGYVLIMSNYAEYMLLTSLRIIRGRTLFFPSPDEHTGFSLFVSHNYKPGSLTVGLKELQLVSLHGQSHARFPSRTQSLALRALRLDGNRAKRKRLPWQAANHGCYCFDRASYWSILLAAACSQ